MTRGYTTPEPPDGYPTVCFKMEVPNAPEYRQAILGQISHLFRWYAWQRTGDRTGAETAEVLKQYALTMEFLETCQQEGVSVIFRQTDCTLEASTDDGQTWFVIFDAEPCKPVITYVDGSIQVDGNTIVTNETIVNNTIIQPDTEHIKGDGLDKRCNLASYLVAIPLPDLVNNLITEKQNAQDDNAFLLAILGLGALVVTGGLAGGFIPALSAGLALGGIATAGAYTTINAVMNVIDLTALQAELTNTFWEQDLKCVIYCNLSSNAILDDEQSIAIADAIDSELTATYPNASPLLSAIFRTMSAESRGKYQTFGALYDGSNCDLCACGPWYYDVFKLQYDYWFSKYGLMQNTTTKGTFGTGAYIDGARTTTYDEVEVILDLSKTPAIITGVAIEAVAYRFSEDSGDRFFRLYYWDESAGTWGIVEESWMWPNGTKRIATYPQLATPTTKIKVIAYGWGSKPDGSYLTQITKFGIWGDGVNVLQQEFTEWAQDYI